MGFRNGGALGIYLRGVRARVLIPTNSNACAARGVCLRNRSSDRHVYGAFASRVSRSVGVALKASAAAVEASAQGRQVRNILQH